MWHNFKQLTVIWKESIWLCGRNALLWVTEQSWHWCSRGGNVIIVLRWSMTNINTAIVTPIYLILTFRINLCVKHESAGCGYSPKYKSLESWQYKNKNNWKVINGIRERKVKKVSGHWHSHIGLKKDAYWNWWIRNQEIHFFRVTKIKN